VDAGCEVDVDAGMPGMKETWFKEVFALRKKGSEDQRSSIEL